MHHLRQISKEESRQLQKGQHTLLGVEKMCSSHLSTAAPLSTTRVDWSFPQSPVRHPNEDMLLGKGRGRLALSQTPKKSERDDYVLKLRTCFQWLALTNAHVFISHSYEALVTRKQALLARSSRRMPFEVPENIKDRRTDENSVFAAQTVRFSCWAFRSYIWLEAITPVSQLQNHVWIVVFKETMR